MVPEGRRALNQPRHDGCSTTVVFTPLVQSPIDLHVVQLEHEASKLAKHIVDGVVSSVHGPIDHDVPIPDANDSTLDTIHSNDGDARSGTLTVRVAGHGRRKSVGELPRGQRLATVELGKGSLESIQQSRFRPRLRCRLIEDGNPAVSPHDCIQAGEALQSSDDCLLDHSHRGDCTGDSEPPELCRRDPGGGSASATSVEFELKCDDLTTPAFATRNATTRSGAVEYRATAAQWHADRQGRRPKVSKLDANDALREYVQDRLADTITGPDGEVVSGPPVRWIGRRQDRRWAKSWSPEQISNPLRVDFPDDGSMRISHEAIYQALYVQGRGALRRELVACLRTGRALRVPRARTAGRGKKFVTAEVMISERPAEADDRAVPGHGKATSSSGWTARRSERSSNAPHGSRCCCTWPTWTASASNPE
jgi:hypothetical protein